MVGGLEQGSAEGTGRGADGPYSAGSTRSKSAGTGTSAWQRHIGPSEGVRLVPKLVGLARLAPTLGGDSHFFHSGYWHLRNWLYMRPEAIFTPPERFFVNRTFSLTCRHRLFGHLMIAHHGYVLEIFTHHR